MNQNQIETAEFTLSILREEYDEQFDYCDVLAVNIVEDKDKRRYLEAEVHLERLKVEVLLAELNLRLLRESCLERLFEIEKEIESLVACSLDLLITEEPEIEVELVLENGSTILIEGEELC